MKHHWNVVMNVAQKMREVLPTLKLGVDNVRTPGLAPECREQWNEGYAIVNGLRYNSAGGFDHDRFRRDYEAMVRSHFPGCVVTFYWQTQEIEVSRG